MYVQWPIVPVSGWLRLGAASLPCTTRNSDCNFVGELVDDLIV